jgi:hypothetical protein
MLKLCLALLWLMARNEPKVFAELMRLAYTAGPVVAIRAYARMCVDGFFLGIRTGQSSKTAQAGETLGVTLAATFYGDAESGVWDAFCNTVKAVLEDVLEESPRNYAKQIEYLRNLRTKSQLRVVQ